MQIASVRKVCSISRAFYENNTKQTSLYNNLFTRMRKKSPAVSSPTQSVPGKRTPPKTTTNPSSSSTTSASAASASPPNRAVSSQNLSATSSSSLNNTIMMLGQTAHLNISNLSNSTSNTNNNNNINNNSHTDVSNMLESTTSNLLLLSHTNRNQSQHQNQHHSSFCASIGGTGPSGPSSSRRQAHFVLETIHLKKCAVLSAELGEQKLLRHDNVSNTVALNKELGVELFTATSTGKEEDIAKAAEFASEETVFIKSSSQNVKSISNNSLNATSNSATKDSSSLLSDNHQQKLSSTSSSNSKSNTASAAAITASATAFSADFNQVGTASDTLGASIEVQSEVDRFFETGVPLVSTDQVPDADALIVVSAGPNAETNANMTLSAVEASIKYMAHRSLCVHVSACAIFGDIDEMLGKSTVNQSGSLNNDNTTAASSSSSPTQQQQQQQLMKTIVDEHGNTVIIELPPDAKVSMFDLLEHGGHRSYKPFVVSEPREPYFDRYTPKHLLRVGLSNEDVEDKLAQLSILCEDQLRKQYSRALGFMFFIDCIHFRDGFQRFTSDKHVMVQSQHPASSLFFSRTTLISTHTPALVSSLVGNLSALPPTALHQSWVTTLRHLGSETHHVLNIIACVPEENTLGYNAEAHAETVLDVDDLSFHTYQEKDKSENHNNSNQLQQQQKANGLFEVMNSQDKPEHIEAKKTALLQLKRAFQVAAALRAAVSAGARAPIADHIFPKRTHLKLPEYVATLKKSHDEHTNDQKTRHSFARSALAYLATQVKGDDVTAVAAMGGLGNDNRERFAAIFRAAFVKNKVMKEQEKRSASNGSGNNNNKNSRSQSQTGRTNQQQQQNQNNNNNNSDSASFNNQNQEQRNFANSQFSLSNLNLSSLLSSVSGGGGTGGDTSKDINKMRQQNEALFLIKERLEFDLAKSDKEVKKLRGELSTSQTKRKRLERELTDAQGRQLVAESFVQKHQTEQDTEVLELRQHILNMQQKIDALERKNNQLSKNMTDQHAEQERRELAMKQQYEHMFGDLRADLDVAVAEKEVLHESLEEHTGRIHAIEELLVQVEVEKKTLNQQLQDSRDAIEQAKAEARAAIERASRMRKAEREEYLKLLEAGKSATEELVTFEDLRVDRLVADDSLYRTGADGVKKWLKSIGGDQYAAVFANAGFNDVLSVANITEPDLHGLKILAGHRRKILAAVDELKVHLNLAIAKRQVAPISHELANFEELIAKQREWYRDFAAVVRAEQANDDDDVFV